MKPIPAKEKEKEEPKEGIKLKPIPGKEKEKEEPKEGAKLKPIPAKEKPQPAKSEPVKVKSAPSKEKKEEVRLLTSYISLHIYFTWGVHMILLFELLDFPANRFGRGEQIEPPLSFEIVHNC